MKQNKIIVICFVFFLIIWLMPDFSSFKREDKRNDNCISLNTRSHPSLFFDEKLFYLGQDGAVDENLQDVNIKGGVIPHHLLPSHMILDFLSRLNKDTKNIILIGPNHYNVGDTKAISSLYNWNTEFGYLMVNSCLVEKLIADNLVSIYEDEIVNEHSLSGLMPYIKYYLPDAKIVPIMLKSMSMDEIDNLSNKLSDIAKLDNTVVIASVDFSHYLIDKDARNHDIITKDALINYNYNKIYSFNDDYMDSPTSIIILLKIMNKMGATNQKIISNTNSGILLNDDSVGTTSYFEIIFSKNEK